MHVNLQGATNAAIWAGANVSAVAVGAATNDWHFTTTIAAITAGTLAFLGAVKLLVPAVADAIKQAVPPLLKSLAEVKAYREELDKGSLSAQIERLQESVTDATREAAEAREEVAEARREAAAGRDQVKVLQGTAEILQGTLDEMKGRVEAANAKLHDVKNQAHQASVAHAAEQLEVRRDLEASRAEVARLTSEVAHLTSVIDQLRAENARLATVATATAKEAKATVEAVAAKVEVNAANIAVLAANSGGFPAVTPDPNLGPAAEPGKG